MNFKNVLAALRRRWYLTVVVFLVVAGAFTTTFALYPPQYSSRAILVVTTPQNGARIAADPRIGNDITNPLFNFQEGQSIAAAILIASAEAPTAQRRVGVEGTDTSYTVTNGDTNPEQSSAGPFIYVDTTARSAQAASDTTAAVVKLIRDDLRARQLALRAEPATFLSVMDVVAPAIAEEQRGNRVLGAVTALMASALVSVALVTRFDRSRLDRTRPKLKSRSTEPSRSVHSESNGIDADTETIAPGARSTADASKRRNRRRFSGRTSGS